MSRKRILARTGLILLTTMLTSKVWAAVSHLAPLSQSGVHALIIPAIIMLVYLLVGGALSIAFLIWAYNNHKWPFDGTFHF